MSSLDFGLLGLDVLSGLDAKSSLEDPDLPVFEDIQSILDLEVPICNTTNVQQEEVNTVSKLNTFVSVESFKRSVHLIPDLTEIGEYTLFPLKILFDRGTLGFAARNFKK